LRQWTLRDLDRARRQPRKLFEMRPAAISDRANKARGRTPPSRDYFGKGLVIFLPPVSRFLRSQGRPWHEVQANLRAASRLRLPDDGTERGGRADPSQGHAGDPDDAGGMRRVDASAVG
jgi:hypothetical protein